MRLREFLYSLVQRCARLGVSLMFTYETMELFRITRLSELGMSHIADNVVLLQHVQDGSQMRRALTVLKSRGSMNSAVISEFHISADGITLGEPLDLRPSGAEPAVAARRTLSDNGRHASSGDTPTPTSAHHTAELAGW